MERTEIKKIAKRIRREAGSNNIYDIIASQDILVREAPTDGPILYGSPACLVISSKSKTIFLSEDIPDELRSFTLAHELGHILLHEEELYRSGIYQVKRRHEEEADLFAFSLLDMRFSSDEIYGKSSTEIAQIYGLRESTAEYIILEMKKKRIRQ